MAHERHADRLLIDDAAGRRAAGEPGVAARGILGVLGTAKAADILVAVGAFAYHDPFGPPKGDTAGIIVGWLSEVRVAGVHPPKRRFQLQNEPPISPDS